MSSVGETREPLCEDDGRRVFSSSVRRRPSSQLRSDDDWLTVPDRVRRRRLLRRDSIGGRTPYDYYTTGSTEDRDGGACTSEDYSAEAASTGDGEEDMSLDKSQGCSQTPTRSVSDCWTKRSDVTSVGHLLHYAGKGDVENVKSLLDAGANIDDCDYDKRTALHIAASDGQYEVAKLLLERGAYVNPEDRWGMTPLAEAIQFRKGEALCQLLREYKGAVPRALGQRISSSESLNDILAPEWEIDSSELDFRERRIIGRGAFGEVKIAIWRGTKVAVKTILRSLEQDKHTIRDFQEEVSLLPKLRHPNIVQFMGAVTLKPPLMLVTEYLPKGDLDEILSREKCLSLSQIIGYALDIARGMNYLHSHKPEAIVHRDLKPRNLLLGDGGHLKVADFGLSKLIHQGLEKYQMTGETGSYRFMAPEVYNHELYDKMVDVFSFAIIVYEMFEGEAPFRHMAAEQAAWNMARGQRPEFQATTYTPRMKELISNCWHSNPRARPSFSRIITTLEEIESELCV